VYCGKMVDWIWMSFGAVSGTACKLGLQMMLVSLVYSLHDELTARLGVYWHILYT